jgi:hypothetical protein
MPLERITRDNTESQGESSSLTHFVSEEAEETEESEDMVTFNDLSFHFSPTYLVDDQTRLKVEAIV